MRLLQIFEAWEGTVEILRQVEHLLRDLDDLFLSGVSNFNQLPHDSVRDEVVPLELLADLEGNVERPNAHK